MASFLYERGSELIAKNDLDPESATIKAALVMGATTCDTERDKLTLSGFTTIDTCDGAGYADQTIAGIAITTGAGNRTIVDGDNITFAALGVGTTPSVGLLIYQDLTGPSLDVPIAYIEFDTPLTHNGDDVPIGWNATLGIFYLQQ